MAAAEEKLKAAKEAQRAQREAQKKAGEERKARVVSLSERLRRSTAWCNCGKPDCFGNHKENCRIRGASGEVLWFGADQALEWYYANDGKSKKGRQKQKKVGVQNRLNDGSMMAQ